MTSWFGSWAAASLPRAILNYRDELHREVDQACRAAWRDWVTP